MTFDLDILHAGSPRRTTVPSRSCSEVKVNGHVIMMKMFFCLFRTR